MDEEQYRLRLMKAIQCLVTSLKRCVGTDGCLMASCTDPDGEKWQIVVQPARVIPVTTITPPGPIVFSQN
jgi:hypothetical protein